MTDTATAASLKIPAVIGIALAILTNLAGVHFGLIHASLVGFLIGLMDTLAIMILALILLPAAMERRRRRRAEAARREALDREEAARREALYREEVERVSQNVADWYLNWRPDRSENGDE